VRVLSATEPADEAQTRARIDAALAAGEWRGPDGVVVRWRLLGSDQVEIAAAETGHAERLRRDPRG
jgi:hypothetical protein